MNNIEIFNNHTKVLEFSNNQQQQQSNNNNNGDFEGKMIAINRMAIIIFIMYFALIIYRVFKTRDFYRLEDFNVPLILGFMLYVTNTVLS